MNQTFNCAKSLLLFSLSTILFMSVLRAETTKVIGYYPNWAIYRNPVFKPEDIDASLVTHINYAFVKVDTAGNLILFDPWADIDYRTDWNTQKPYWGNFLGLKTLKEHNPHLQTLFSVGGWTLSDTFSDMAANPSARQNFVSQCIKFCDTYGFDGIDVDWEYPGYEPHKGSPRDKENFTSLLQELHKAAKQHSRELLVTIAAPAGPSHYQNIEVNKIHEYLDWINLMCYDFAGAGWCDVTNHHAPLYAAEVGDPRFNCDAAIQYYLSQGVPASKLVMGLPLYGRSFATTSMTHDGLFSTYHDVGGGTTVEPGMRFFYDIKRHLLPYYNEHWDEQAKAPYLFNPYTGEFVTYENEKSLSLKCDYIKQQGLGGAMVWELGLDTRPEWDAMRVINEIRH